MLQHQSTGGIYTAANTPQALLTLQDSHAFTQIVIGLVPSNNERLEAMNNELIDIFLQLVEQTHAERFLVNFAADYSRKIDRGPVEAEKLLIP